jgi:hypothetical protein
VFFNAVFTDTHHEAGADGSGKPHGHYSELELGNVPALVP